jgi:hypothetical protein
MALGIGDLSPLYHDEAYAAGTRWGKLLAPYIMIQTFDTLRSVGSSGLPEGLPGVHSIWTGSLYEWKRPLAVGDRLTAECYLKAVDERQSRFGGGRPSIRRRGVYGDHRRPIGPQRHWIRTERHKTAETKKCWKIELAEAGDIERFRGVRRGDARARLRQDVKVGDSPEAREGPAHADGGDRFRVAARHLPRRYRRRNPTRSTRSSSS